MIRDYSFTNHCEQAIQTPHSEAGSLSGSLTFSTVVPLENFFKPFNAQLDISSALKPSPISPA